MRHSKYEQMRTDGNNWKFGFVYFCPQDPRVIVRQRHLLGWTWNFAHSRVVLAILAAIGVFLTPPAVGWLIGVRSPSWLIILAAVGLTIVVFGAHRASKDPEA